MTPVNRQPVIDALVALPDEAFGWFIVWAARGAPQGAHTQPDYVGQLFPDGLGGFQEASQEAIERLRAAAQAWIEEAVA